MARLNTKPPVVIDNGTGYTKMGYAGSEEPSYVIPTLIGHPVSQQGGAAMRKGGEGLGDMDFYIGNEALMRKKTYPVTSPIKQGIIENWNHMEKMWERSIFNYLRCEPEEHYFLLTEPPFNTPENREFTAEVMFETFNVPGIYIAVQAVLALAASWTSKAVVKSGRAGSLTGTVIDSGDGVTHVIPVAEGYVIGSCIRNIPLAGRDITQFVYDRLLDREEPIPAADRFQAARTIKEKFCYTCKEMVAEFGKYDNDPKKFEQFSGVSPKSKKKWTADVGYERFLGPELFFKPEIFKPQLSQSLSEVVDRAILACPIDTRRDLYSNIVLSGGSTMFKNFEKRLRREIKERVTKRREANAQQHKNLDVGSVKEVEVNVVSHPKQRYAVWFGGSMIAHTAQFKSVCHSKEKYYEVGPRLVRHNQVFTGI